MARRKITVEFKFTLEAFKEKFTLEELGVQMNVAPSQISRWVKEFKMNGKNIFTKDNKLSRRQNCLKRSKADFMEL